MILRIALVAACASAAHGFAVGTKPASAKPRASVAMGDKSNNTPAKFAPKGAFGGKAKPGKGQAQGWIGDRSKSTQVTKFEEGSDFLFFQGPAPKSAVQENLPSFFSAENFQDLEIKPLQIAVTATGFGSLLAIVALLSGPADGVKLPSAPKPPKISAPAMPKADPEAAKAAAEAKAAKEAAAKKAAEEKAAAAAAAKAEKAAAAEAKAKAAAEAKAKAAAEAAA